VTTILLARHGETDWNRDLRFQGHADVPLNDTGRAQARELARSLAEEPFDAVYSSDLLRARETAEIVASRLGLAVELDEGLREIDVGSWQGSTRSELDGREWDGEAYDDHRRRTVASILRIAERHPDASVLVVAHGGTLRRIQEATAGEPLALVENCGTWTVTAENGRLTAPS
jgi:broad specificity phosphatase PhoE